MIYIICWLAASSCNRVVGQEEYRGNILVHVAKGGILNLNADYLIAPDGTRDISNRYPSGIGDHPDWSPDGKWIAFDTQYGLGGLEKSAIYIMPSDGGRRIKLELPHCPCLYPSWSKDGKSLAFYKYENEEIYIVNVSCLIENPQNSECRLNPQLITQGSAPDWSPIQDRIVYIDFYKDIGVKMIDLEAKTKPIDFTPNTADFCSSARWSPDGEQIVASCVQKTGDFGIYLISISNGEVINITNRFEKAVYIQADWSPDGKHITFVSNRDGLGQQLGLGSAAISSNALFMIDLDGTNITRLTLSDREDILWYKWIK